MFRRVFVFGKETPWADCSSADRECRENSGEEKTGCRPAGSGRNEENAVGEKAVCRPAERVRVTAEDFYNPEKGFGFVTEKNRREQAGLQLHELNAGFGTWYWYQDEDLTEIREEEDGCFLDSQGIVERLEAEEGEASAGEKGRIPLIFKADVPHAGNYRVTVALRGLKSAEELLIFIGCRRLGYLGGANGKPIDKTVGIPQGTEKDAAPEPESRMSICEAENSLCVEGQYTSSDTSAGAHFEGDSEISQSTVFTRSFTVNVCDIVPRGQTACFENKSINIAILVDRPKISSLRIEEFSCPTLYIAGDSTVTDQSAEYPYEPGACYSGWGQMLPAFLDGRIAVSNHAHSGLTTASFRSEGHYDIVRRFLRPGDYFFLQFGHNDQKLQELLAEGGYRENLLRYIGECRQVGVYPVIVTPLARNSWKGNDGTYNDLLAEYAAVCRRTGEQEGVPVLDLHARSVEYILREGLEAAKDSFHPGDYTHSNDYGAYRFAGMVAEEIRRVCGDWTQDGCLQGSDSQDSGQESCPQGVRIGESSSPQDNRPQDAYRFLAECVTEGFGPWEPKERPTMPEKPKIYEDRRNPFEGELLFSGLENPEQAADRATVLDLLIQAAHFFPTNVYNDMFRDVVGHEWYAGAVECAYQNGMIEEHLVEDGCFFPERAVTLEEFLVLAVNAYRSRKSLPEEVPCAYDGSCRSFARSYVRAACALGLIDGDGSEDLSRVISRGEAAEKCAKMKL
ncbi:MAG: GDSL-type esterase/lipase family protein [Roseburia sp.]|nr:GDSL-type esterase/lipase family protein [Roseburia sp.]MCM1098398.1 GDSL-type esterase/lipase family protein [Ruminococcus flavefaciens]